MELTHWSLIPIVCAIPKALMARVSPKRSVGVSSLFFVAKSLRCLKFDKPRLAP